ncbi:hypothetical protein [Calorimonas adulescens]|nr:hypothetical protein [Calorimonas adulescens]
MGTRRRQRASEAAGRITGESSRSAGLNARSSKISGGAVPSPAEKSLFTPESRIERIMQSVSN